jgi:hydroxyacylglutathione hydrolase
VFVLLLNVAWRRPVNVGNGAEVYETQLSASGAATCELPQWLTFRAFVRNRALSLAARAGSLCLGMPAGLTAADSQFDVGRVDHLLTVVRHRYLDTNPRSALVLIRRFPAQVAGTNCFVVAPGDGEQCIVIDPGVGVTDAIDEIVTEHRLHPVAVVLTHGHLDHTFSVLPVCQARDVPAFIHPADRSALADPWTGLGLPVGAPLFGVEGLTFAEPQDVRTLDDGATLTIAGLSFVVRHAPGHTPGSVVFSLLTDEAGVLFSGDVLFAGSIGRSDLPGGSTEQMMSSLRTVILPMDDEVIVCPGHGPETTIGRERATNPFLKDLM